MTRVAIFARYSSDQQRDASIEDQLRVCRTYAERAGWTIAGEYADHALSGATTNRPDFKKLDAAIRDGSWTSFWPKALTDFRVIWSISRRSTNNAYFGKSPSTRCRKARSLNSTLV
jgi:DNA invertase Pin-like site-specific DNA recombinase